MEFEQKWKENTAVIKRHCFNLAGRDLGDDLFTQTWIKASRGYPTFHGKAQFKTWVYQICRNAWIDMCRYRKETLQLLFAEQTPDEFDIESITEAKLAIEYLAAKLPIQYWDIIKMFHIDQLSYTDLSLILDVPIGTVKSRLNRARASAKEILLTRTDQSQA